MAINLKTEEGAEFSFDTVAEFMEFKKQIEEEEASKESVAESDISKKESKFDIGDKIKVVENKSSGHVNGTIGEIVGVEYFESENKWSYVVHPISDYLFEQSLRHEESDLELFKDEIEVGDKVRVISAKDGTSVTFHKFDMGSIVEVEEVYGNGRIEAFDGILYQTLLHHHYEKVEGLGKDSNGKDLYTGDFVTGTEDNDYGYTNSKVVMEVVGEGRNFLDEEANILVRIVGESGTYSVNSSKFIKLSDNLDEAKAKFEDNKGGGRVRNSSPKFQTGDIVRVTEEFEDHFGDRAKRGSVYEYDENFGFAEPFVGTVFLGDNIDNLELVCRAQDRLDK